MTAQRMFVAFAFAAAVAASARVGAQAGGAAVPFKLGTFEQNGRMFIGLVLRDVQVVDIAQANTAFEAANRGARRLTAPADMKQLCDAFDAGDLAGAQALHRRLFGLCRDLLGLASNPIPIKAALAMLGRDTGEVRLPLVPLEPALAHKLRGVLAAYGLRIAHALPV